MAWLRALAFVACRFPLQSAEDTGDQAPVVYWSGVRYDA
jgi:hypothetical protein